MEMKLAYTWSEIIKYRIDISEADSPGAFLNALLQSENNTVYKSLLTEKDNAIKEINEFIKTSAEDECKSLEEIRSFFTNELLKKYDIEVLLYTLYAVLLKENQTGPSVYTQYVDEEKCPIDHNGPLIDFEFDPISYKNKKLQNILVQHFSIESETFYKRMQFLILMYAL